MKDNEDLFPTEDGEDLFAGLTDKEVTFRSTTLKIKNFTLTQYKNLFSYISITVLVAAASYFLYQKNESLMLKKELLTKAEKASRNVKPVIFHRETLGDKMEIIAKAIPGTETYVIVFKKDEKSLFKQTDRERLDYIFGNACFQAMIEIVNNKVDVFNCDGEDYKR